MAEVDQHLVRINARLVATRRDIRDRLKTYKAGTELATLVRADALLCEAVDAIGSLISRRSTEETAPLEYDERD